MSYKTGLNTMDKYFFGKTFAQWAKENVKPSKKTTEFVESSFDDFNKHFDFMLQAFKKPLERTPETDVYVPRKTVTYANIEDSFRPSF